MADRHPYVSGSGPIFQIVNHLRKSFPAGGVTGDTLKKLGLAPNNESYVINILRFVGIIEEDGKRTDAAASVFSQHDDAKFQQAFSGLVESAYSGLFELHRADAWELDLDDLIQYFRSTDGTSAIVGRRQATTFQALSALSGHGEVPPAKQAASRKARAEAATSRPSVATSQATPGRPSGPPSRSGSSAVRVREVGLTVRIEVNLPAEGDQQTYDRIFRSIRENLIDA